MEGPSGWPPGSGGSDPGRSSESDPGSPPASIPAQSEPRSPGQPWSQPGVPIPGFPPPAPPPHPGYPGPPGHAVPAAYPGYPGPASYPGPYAQPGPPGHPPGYPGQPWAPGYGPPAQPAYSQPHRGAARRPWHRRPIVYIAVALIALLAGVAVFFVITSSPPITADEKSLIGQCVTVKGNAVQLIDCGKAHNGKVTAVAPHYNACPSGTSAFRIHSGISNDHSGCYVPDVTGAQ